MPNTFVALDVPSTDGEGAPTPCDQTGRLKSFVFDGTIRPGGRYIVEGSVDGGVTWDLLVGPDRTQVFFTSDNGGTKSVDAIVTHVRVRSEGNGTVPAPPSITLGTPPATGTNTFQGLPVPLENGLGPVVDLGDSTGPFKTLVLRRTGGPIPPGSRYSVLASMDGSRFDEVALFTADRQGTKSVEVMCRFMQVLRQAVGDAPAISVGAEGLAGDGAAACPILSFTVEGERTATEVEEIVGEWLVDFSSLAATGSDLGVFLSAIGRVTDLDESWHLRLYVGGPVGVIDPPALVAQVDASPGTTTEFTAGVAASLPLPLGQQIVQLTLQSGIPEESTAHVRGAVVQFSCPPPI